ncbi:hypothetical protein ROHU_018794 [Xyrichtys novacula]|uniref:Uncharacterized protein n=1 Tax=Xyrichtys novacula TaxID=13765 RepID=A0AAV1FZI1_XYRNO|nr:hypothetical protein ROHU_018794 [Xyrichtys novacula]
MKVKAAKSRSLSIRKGERQDNTTFVAGGEPIPKLAEKPLKSLGRQYMADLSDRQMGKQAKQQLAQGLAKIDKSQLPGKHKVWCYQHTLYQRVMWPLKICEIPMSEVSRMDNLANSYIRKWMGLPRCFSDVGLCGWNMLELPLKSITLGYKQEKAHLVLEMRDSADRLVRSAEVPIRTGRKWKAPEEVENAIARLQHKEVMGATQTSHAGLGWAAPRQFWSKATRRERKTMVVDKVTRVEQERFHIKAISQGSQGAWTQWAATVQGHISWADIWRTPQSMASFLIRAAYVRHSHSRTTQWFGSGVGCPLCDTTKVELTQGRFSAGIKRRRATGCGSGGRTADGGKHLSEGSCRGWQGDVPISHCPPARRCTGVGGETSVNGGLQLTTLQLFTLAPEEMRQAGRPKQDLTPDLYNDQQMVEEEKRWKQIIEGGKRELKDDDDDDDGKAASDGGKTGSKRKKTNDGACKDREKRQDQIMKRH